MEGAIGHADDDAVHSTPAHSLIGILVHTAPVRVVQQKRPVTLEGAALRLLTAVEHDCKLLPADVVIGSKSGFTVPAQDTHTSSPADSLSVVGV